MTIDLQQQEDIEFHCFDIIDEENLGYTDRINKIKSIELSYMMKVLPKICNDANSLSECMSKAIDL